MLCGSESQADCVGGMSSTMMNATATPTFSMASSGAASASASAYTGAAVANNAMGALAMGVGIVAMAL